MEFKESSLPFIRRLWSSRDLIAIAICDSNRESQVTSDLKHCGAGVRPRPRRGPGNHPCEFRCPVCVCDAALLACDIVRYGVSSVLSVSLSRLVSDKRVGEVSEHTLSESKIPCSSSFYSCVLRAVPMVGRHLCLSVPWSLKTTLRKEGRPMGPATPRAFDSSVC